MKIIGTSAGLFVLLIVAISFLTACSGKGKTADADLQKIEEELTKLGNGHWKITTLERDGSTLNIHIQVDDDPGKVTFREGAAAEEAVLNIIPDATGRLAWSSVQGIGLRTVLLEGGGPTTGGDTEESME